MVYELKYKGLYVSHETLWRKMVHRLRTRILDDGFRLQIKGYSVRTMVFGFRTIDYGQGSKD